MSSVEAPPILAGQPFTDLQAEIVRLQHLLRLKDEQIRLLNLRLLGPKSEKLSCAQIPLLLGEVSLTAGEVEQEAERPEAEKQNPLPKAKQPRPNHPGRNVLSEHLERREEVLGCPPEECRCSQCGAERPVIGYEIREELACAPAQYWVRVIQREKRGSPCLEEQGVVTAAAPEQIVPKSKFSDEFIIEVLARKYQQHLPIYRQCASLAEDHGIEISRKTLTDAVLAAGVRAQAAELTGGPYLQADETPVPCQTGERTGHNHRAYLWEYSRPGGPVVFDFQMGRSRAGPEKFLKDFAGKLQTDGYAAYADFGEQIVHVGCMAHARRGFVDTLKVAPQDPFAAEVIARLGTLYAVEKQAREAGWGRSSGKPCGKRRALR